MASTSARRPSAGTLAAHTVFPDEIWEEIFLCLDAAADLARASAACSSFRRIVSECRLLRRFRSLRSPAVLGFITRDRHEFVPVDPPHRSAPEARALQQAADFTLSFVPKPASWGFRHALDGRVLLGQDFSIKTQFEDLLVCDPLHHRYVKIPRIPEDLMASTPRIGSSHLLPVLAPAGEDDEESFRVICTVQHKGKGKVMAFVFSSCSQMWQSVSSTICLPNGLIEYVPYYAHGCLYWMFYEKSSSLMFDTSKMKFSIIDLPPHSSYSKHAIVEAEEGRLWFLTIVDGTIDLYCKNWQSNAVGSQEWLHKKLIPLPKESGIDYSWFIEGTAGHYLALVAHHGFCTAEHFLLDMKTLLLELLCTSSNGAFYCFPYARFPPPLALPSI